MLPANLVLTPPSSTFADLLAELFITVKQIVLRLLRLGWGNLVCWYDFILGVCLGAALLLLIFAERWINSIIKLSTCLTGMGSIFLCVVRTVDIKLAHKIFFNILFKMSEVDEVDRHHIYLKCLMSWKFFHFFLEFYVLGSVETQIWHELFQLLFFILKGFVDPLYLFLYVNFSELKLIENDFKYLLIVLVIFLGLVFHKEHVVYLVLFYLLVQNPIVLLHLFALFYLFRVAITAIKVFFDDTRIIQQSFLCVIFLSRCLRQYRVGEINFDIVSFACFHIILSLILYITLILLMPII
jgi:hypothetical protein